MKSTTMKTILAAAVFAAIAGTTALTSCNGGGTPGKSDSTSSDGQYHPRRRQHVR